MLDWRKVSLTTPLKPCGDRETFERGHLVDGGVAALNTQDSGSQKALASADALIRRRPDAPALAAGDTADILDF